MALSVVVHGSFGEGFRVVGPFKTAEHAADWACVNTDADWWVAPLEASEEKEKQDGKG